MWHFLDISETFFVLENQLLLSCSAGARNCNGAKYGALKCLTVRAEGAPLRQGGAGAKGPCAGALCGKKFVLCLPS